ncbi:hypothetical protein H0W80_02155, partial [Candidatus Saccharibacteria bacterium]|nr:hypothetical protein [Candidatus Saccharibacteria bacterium]
MKKLLQIFSVFLLSCLAVVLFGVANHQEAKASGPWACVTNGGNAGKWENAGVIKACDDFFVYDPVLSGEAKVAVFVSGKDAGSDDGGHGPVFKITLAPGTGSDIGYILTDNSGNKLTGDFIKNNANAKVPFVATDTKKEFCSTIKSTDCDPYNGDKVVVQDGTLDSGHAGGFNINTAKYTGPGITDATQKAAGSAAANEGDCIVNPLSFFLCPLRDAIVQTVDGLTGFLIGQLRITPLTSQGGVQDGFNRFKNVANTLYILIFLVIIFSNFFSTGLDNYSIKKMLPRLIAAVIATQFGFLICSLLVDLSNVVTITIPSIVDQTQTLGQSIGGNFLDLAGKQQGAGSFAEGLNGGVSGVAYFVILLFLAIALLVIVIIALGYLIFRNVFLIVLVFISPLAFAAWVLPQTQQYAKKWATWFIKLLVMGPIVGLILAVTVVIQTIFQNSTDKFMNFISVFVPFIGIAIIPKSFKWSTDVMSAAGKVAAGSAVGKAATKSFKEGKAGDLTGKAVSGVGGKVPGFGTAATKYGAKKQAVYAKGQKENYGDFATKDLIKLSTAKGATGENARRTLTSKRSDMAYELARNANNGIAPSEQQLKVLRQMNEALVASGQQPIRANIPAGTSMPSDANPPNGGTDWSDVVTVLPAGGGPSVGGSGGSTGSPVGPPTPSAPPTRSGRPAPTP